MSDTAKRVLITGRQGFTGHYVTAELESSGKYCIYGIGETTSSSPNDLQIDLEDYYSLEQAITSIQPNVVIHLAAVAFVGHANANEFYQTNLIGTLNLLKALSQCRAKPSAVLLASSANIYGNISEGILSETSPPVPTNDYAVSKLSMEYMAHLWMDRLPIILTRPFNYTGIGQSENFLIPKIVAHFRNRASSIELGNLDVWRDFSDVRFVAQAYRSLIESKAFGKTVNICSGRTHSLREIITMCEKITGHHLDIHTNPTLVRSNEVKSLCGSAALLKTLIAPWEVIPFEKTLRWMLESQAGN